MAKYNSPYCTDDMTFQDCELAILRHSVDKSDKHKKRKTAENPSVTTMIEIVESFLRNNQKECICYGGTAINNLLPEKKRFYDKTIDVPDYDFYAVNALEIAMDLADLFFAEGYIEVEAKAGVHRGTFKVFVNFMPIADVSTMAPKLFHAILKEAKIIGGISYAPPNFLRMSMFLELSRPRDNVSRWEKVFKRMELLNESYPLKKTSCKLKPQKKVPLPPEIKLALRDAFAKEEVVFLGGYALSEYSKYVVNPRYKRWFADYDSFDVLASFDTAKIIQQKVAALMPAKNVRLLHHSTLDEIIPEHIEIRVGDAALAFIYRPLSCHSYNRILLENDVTVRIATIDTMLSFYLAFMYANKPYMQPDRILCMASFLFDIQQQNRLAQTGVLRRFSLSCYGKAITLEDIRAKKNEMYQRLRHNKYSREYQKWFLQYRPEDTQTIHPNAVPKTHRFAKYVLSSVDSTPKRHSSEKRKTKRIRKKTNNASRFRKRFRQTT